MKFFFKNALCADNKPFDLLFEYDYYIISIKHIVPRLKTIF